VSVAGAVVLLGEHLTLTMIAGGALILAGVAVSSLTRPRRASDPHLPQKETVLPRSGGAGA
jgi:drug/metabolite transporter (DMT)-like permease